MIHSFMMTSMTQLTYSEGLDGGLRLHSSLATSNLLTSNFGSQCEDSVLNNYRPISVLPIVAMVMERIVFDQIYNFLQHHSLLTPLQSGFRPEHSTQDVLVKMLDDWRRGIDADHIIASLFLDLSKAFDTINHAYFLQKLELNFGVRGHEHDWFQ